jgi:protocatechuate 3,4-dioxygenase beta subunit
MSTGRWLVAAFLLSALPVAAVAQPVPPGGRGGQGIPIGPGGRGQIPPRDRQAEAPRGTGVLRGSVVAADNSTPIRRAQVRVNAQGVGSRLTTTDAQGRFEIRDLPAGRYRINASKGGFVPLEYGQRRPSESGTPIELADAQKIDKLIIALPRGSVIGGRITDEFGEPVANAVVAAMRYGYQQGTRRLLPAGGTNSRDTTDDQGSFRLFGLSPGEYVISAALRTGAEEVSDPAGENTGYAPTYFPGTTSVGEAQRVTVGLGQEQAGVVFSLIATRLVRVSGAVISSQGAPVPAGQVILTPAGTRVGAGALQGMSARIEQGGQFRLRNVPPGRYLAQVRTMMGGGPGGRGQARTDPANEFGRQDVTVGNEDLDGVVIVTAPGGRVTGLIASENGAVATLRPQQVSVNARVAEIDIGGPGGAGGNGRVNEDWTFEINGLFEARIFRVGLPQGWNLKSITLNGQDITDTPVDIPPGQTVSGVQILLTDKSTEINGRLADGRGNAVTDATIVIFPADDSKWTAFTRFVRSARPDQDGRFQIRGLPPEKYLAVAVQGLEDGQASDPEFLASVREQGTSFSLGDAEVRSLELRWRP